MRSCLSVLLLLVLAGCGHPAASAEPRVDAVVLETRETTHTLDLEVAATPREWQRGLMNRQSLDGIDGMLFLFSGYREHAMWMKNTFIPLDILFLDKAGAVTTIHRNARPHDLTSLPSDGPAKGAIELMAGDADRLGIAVGDVVRHSAFGDQ